MRKTCFHKRLWRSTVLVSSFVCPSNGRLIFPSTNTSLFELSYPRWNIGQFKLKFMSFINPNSFILPPPSLSSNLMWHSWLFFGEEFGPLHPKIWCKFRNTIEDEFNSFITEWMCTSSWFFFGGGAWNLKCTKFWLVRNRNVVKIHDHFRKWFCRVECKVIEWNLGRIELVLKLNAGRKCWSLFAVHKMGGGPSSRGG